MAAWQGLGQFVLGGEAVALDVDVIPDFNALPSRKREEEVQLCASTCWP
jgi:ATP-dependent DNA ligase